MSSMLTLLTAPSLSPWTNSVFKIFVAVKVKELKSIQHICLVPVFLNHVLSHYRPFELLRNRFF